MLTAQRMYELMVRCFEQQRMSQGAFLLGYLHRMREQGELEVPEWEQYFLLLEQEMLKERSKE